MPTFRAMETATLLETYGYVLSYLDFGPRLTQSQRNILARLTVVAASARLRSKKGLSSFVDAHILSAEIVELFLLSAEIVELFLAMQPVATDVT